MLFLPPHSFIRFGHINCNIAMHCPDLRDIQGGKVVQRSFTQKPYFNQFLPQHVQITRNWLQAGHDNFINSCFGNFGCQICLKDIQHFISLGLLGFLGLFGLLSLLGSLLVAVLLVQPGTVTSGGPRIINYIINHKPEELGS